MNTQGFGDHLLSAGRLKMLRRAATRHGRGRDALFICEGSRCCREAVARRPRWLEFVVISPEFAESADAAELIALCKPHGIEIINVPGQLFKELALTEAPQGILALGTRQEPSLPEPATMLAEPFTLVLERLNDPGNLGTILRTAWAVGLQRVWCTKGTTDAFGPKAVRAGMGAQFALDIHMLEDLNTVRETLAGYGIRRFWHTSPHQGISCFSAEFDFSGAALVLGNEALGLTEQNPDDLYVNIPMPGNAESLNVAQAATVFMFENVRRRQ